MDQYYSFNLSQKSHTCDFLLLFGLFRPWDPSRLWVVLVSSKVSQVLPVIQSLLFTELANFAVNYGFRAKHRSHGTSQGYVLSGSHGFYHHLCGFHDHDTLLYISIRWILGIHLGVGLEWYAARRLAVVFGIVLARRRHGSAIPLCHVGTHSETRNRGVCQIPSRLYCSMFQSVGAGLKPM